MVPQGYGSCQKSGLWHLEAALFKSFLQSRVDPGIRRRRKYPGFTGKVCQIDLAAACPQAIGISGNDDFVVEEDFHANVLFLVQRPHNSRQDEVAFATA